ncbi:uncharacterized protein RJT20DRAFT_147912 [Scheffersomyces xylosifermentans]|uniref:uncharacterized protein n=1 Tax=Scheffersomyces xylosifermentans TaxID=1304137 RepID=UPI00315CA07F
MNLDPIDITKVNPTELLQDAKAILEKIESSWKKSKLFSYKLEKSHKEVPVQTYNIDSLNGVSWCARVTDFKQFDSTTKLKYHQSMLKYILGSTSNLDQTHTEYEKEYIHELYDYKVSKLNLGSAEDGHSLTYSVKLYYKFQFPLKKRVFYELVHIYRPEDSYDAYVISLAAKPEQFESSTDKGEFVVGRYTSIEKITFNAEGDTLKWTMCTCSTPGGLIPNWLTNASINGAIAKDVPSFLNWIDKYDK